MRHRPSCGQGAGPVVGHGTLLQSPPSPQPTCHSRVISTDQAAPPTEREATLRRAMQAHGSGDFKAARQIYESWLAQAPRDADALHLLGVLEAQTGAPAAAEALIARAIEQAPGEGMFHNNLGNVCVELGRLDDAEANYRRAVQLDTTRLDAANNLAVILSRRGREAEASAIFEALTAAAPGFADARLNHAQHCLRSGRYGDAVTLCMDGLVTDPKSNAMRRLLGAAYSMMGMHGQATELYRRWVEAEPDNPTARHHLAACLGTDVPLRASDAYVSEVFDGFATSFDAKLAALGYRAPALVQGWVEAQVQNLANLAGGQRDGDGASGGAPPWRVLDAGCGTGLVGPLVRPHASRLVGVDLSAGMLRKAEQRQVYDDLFRGELVAFLDAWSERIDLLMCADTLCYFGPLDAFARGARRVLVPGGRLVATVEAHPAPDDAHEPAFKLHPHGRYSHGRRHVEAALSAAGFTRIELAGVHLRNEGGQPVAGWLIGAHVPTNEVRA
jgi:predicted TPR repeat methyltransferase